MSLLASCDYSDRSTSSTVSIYNIHHVEFHGPDIQKAISANRLFQVRTISNFKD